MNVESCCGCSACAAACPRNAIKLEPNGEGFYVPSVEQALCVHCGICETVCPIGKKYAKDDFEPIPYICRNRNAEIVRESSSGGVFRALGQTVIADHGSVYGCAWNDVLKATHICAATAEDLQKLSKSKYVQSDLNGSFRAIKGKLDHGEFVLFSGTPCQVAGLYSYLRHDYDNLITVDLICHGVPSAKVLDRYLRNTEKQAGSPIQTIDFRDKTNGWNTLTLKLTFEDGQIIFRKASEDPYYRAFLCNLSLSGVCGSCRFNCLPRRSDITLGDFWSDKQAMFQDNKGVSCVIINSPKGKGLFSATFSEKEYTPVSINNILDKNPFLNGHCKLHPRRAQFFTSLENQDFKENVDEKLHPTRGEMLWEISRYKTMFILKKVKNAGIKASTYFEKLRMRRKLKSVDFTIFSNNCWGSFIYQKYGLQYRSPTVGLYIPGDDFVRFCANWQTYLTKELKFIPWEAARLYPQIKDQQPYPVALLGDVEIYFMHYHSEQEAREKWARRCARVNPERVVFKLSQRECCGRADVERFLSLPLEHKICFSYDEVPGAVVIPELRELVGNEQPLAERYFDELDYLNRL